MYHESTVCMFMVKIVTFQYSLDIILLVQFDDAWSFVIYNLHAKHLVNGTTVSNLCILSECNHKMLSDNRSNSTESNAVGINGQNKYKLLFWIEKEDNLIIVWMFKSVVILHDWAVQWKKGKRSDNFVLWIYRVFIS